MSVRVAQNLGSNLHLPYYSSMIENYGPQKKEFFLEEWPWTSIMNRSLLPYFSLTFFTQSMMATIYGNTKSAFFLYCLLRSLPATPVLVLPRITPSGFSIGTILKITFQRSSTDYRDQVIKLLISPFTMWLPVASLGCTRPVIITTHG